MNLDVSQNGEVAIAITLWGKCLTTYDFDKSWPFPRLLRESGLPIVPLRSGDANYYVALDHFPNALRQVEKTVSVSNRLLFAIEPRSVSPAQYSTTVRSKYAVTIVQSRRQRINESDVVIDFGPLYGHFVERRLGARKYSVGIVNENKFSFVAGNLYKARVKCIRTLASAGYQVNLAGKNWDRGLGWQLHRQLLSLGVCFLAREKIDPMSLTLPLRPRDNIRLAGRVESAKVFLEQFQFALVIENDPDYVSEKLFNAIEAGCIPLYMGPPLIEFGIPANVVIPINMADGDVAKAIKNLSEGTRNAILDAGFEWIANRTTRDRWSHETALRNIVLAIEGFVTQR